MGSQLWPAWLSTAALRAYWSDIYQGPLAAFQTIALDGETVVGLSNSIPLHLPVGEALPDAGWDAVLEWGVQGAQGGPAANTLSALSVAIRPEQRGTGLARLLL